MHVESAKNGRVTLRSASAATKVNAQLPRYAHARIDREVL